MDNIEKLLQYLDTPAGDNDGDGNLENMLQALDTQIDESSRKVNSDNYVETILRSQNNNDNKKKNTNYINRAQTFDDDNFSVEATKKELSSKYCNFGYEIHKNLKENLSNRFESGERKTKSSWNINKTHKEKSDVLSVVSTKVAPKNDVYAEPVFGLRLINPIVSSSFIESKMAGKQPVAVSNISYHLRCGDKNVDWVFAGAIVFKSGLKTSQKGSQYCLWKISDLKQDFKQVTVYLFGKACSDLWKVSLGTVTGILNAVPFHKDEKVSNDDLTLTVNNADQIMIWGTSRDYGICKAKKKNGDDCTSFVNKSQCEFCIYHVKNEYNKYAGTRSNLQSSTSSMGLNNLRNKVLGKSEVFYGGKSYTALKPPSRNNKVEQRNNHLLNQLALNPAKNSIQKKELDSQRLEKLSSPSCSQDRSADSNSSDFERGSKKSAIIFNDREKPVSDKNNLNETKNLDKLTKPNNQKGSASTGQKCEKTQPEELSDADQKTFSNTTKPITCRLNLLKLAGERMLETGQPTRILWDEPKNKKIFSFAEVFTPDSVSNSVSPNTPTGNNLDNNTNKKVTLNKNEKIIDLSIDVRPVRLINDFKGLQSNELLPSMKNKCSGNVGSSRLINDFKGLLNNEPTPSIKKQKQSQEMNTLNSAMRNNLNDNFKVNTLLQLHSSGGNSIRERKKALAKLNAVHVIKKTGGLTKTNPNQVRPDALKRKSLKRAAELFEDEETEESLEKSVLSERFVDLMNAQSKHENLVQLAEEMEQHDYFNKMEKKEQLEEKMLSTFKVPCKAVMCLKCKYKWFSASDLCRAEGHPIKVIDAVKRYFKCGNCTNRTVSLEVVPLVSCKQCGSSKWSRAPMIREKLAKCDNSLSIRGDEINYLDSLSSSMNINLLVPMDK